MEYPYEKIEEQLMKLPEDLQRAVTSVGVAELIRQIANDNKLLIDQSDTFFGLTTYVMLGLLPMKDFKQSLMSELRISELVAIKLIQEINEKIFAKVRESLQKIQNQDESSSQQNQQAITEVEKAGNFTVEKEENQGNNSNTLPQEIMKQIHDDEMLKKDEKKEDIIKKIENPGTNDTSIIGFTMKGPIVAAKQTEVHTAQTPPSKPAESPKAGPDPYREQIK